MKRIALFLALFCLTGFSRANPIPPPPIISELYLIDSMHWYLELVFPKNYINLPPNLNGCKLVTSAGTFIFKNGILVTADSILVITQDSMLTPFKINRSGEQLHFDSPTGYLYDYLYFGNVSASQISAPRPGQSIVNYADSCWDISQYPHSPWCHKVKDNHPTIGYSAFYPYQPQAITTTGTFTGVVYDKAHLPVKGVHIGHQYYNAPSYICQNFFESTVTDSLGKFTIPEYSGRYSVSVFFAYQNILADSLLDIEPDSINYYEFTIDTFMTGSGPDLQNKNVRLSCYPNPSTGETTISFDGPANKYYSQALIKIYSANGEAVRILPVTPNTQSVKWDGIHHDGVAASGIYTCVLEINGHKTATEKIIIIQ